MIYPNVKMTFGYTTKNNRIRNNIEKSHSSDAYCITGNLNAKRNEEIFIQKFVRKNNRSLFKANQLKGGRWKANKAPYEVLGYRLYDKVKAEGEEWYIFGRRNTGYFDLRDLTGNKLNKSSYSYKKTILLERNKTLLTERRKHIPPPLSEVGVSCALVR
ncbi:MAG: hypothetical protein FWG21_07320 [Oscillospiraceae bacterium]|nr:hypothetical protein [Oscillospiraceae bacterium]